MLRSFRLSNYRSFRDEQELLLLPGAGCDRAVTPLAAVFGANAAGKSNLLSGLQFMVKAVRDSYRRWEPDGGVPRRPFRLDKESATRSSVFVVDLVLDRVRRVYGFEVDDERILSEWLYAYPQGRKRVLFEREGDKVNFGGTVPELKGSGEVLAKLTRPNALYLSLGAQLGVPELSQVASWFTRRLRWSGKNRSQPNMMALCEHLERDGDRERLLGLVKAADIGISEFRIDEDEQTQRQPPLVEYHFNHETMKTFLQFIRGDDHSRNVRLLDFTEGVRRRLRFLHGTCDEPFDLSEESDGTISWLAMLPGVLASLDTGATMVVDEIDASLHSQLTAQLIRLFQSKDINPHGAQLVFTTHDASLLGTSFGEELLRRDQIWFVEKDSDGASRLYPLSDFHPRKEGENRERRYLAGSYGAVPVLSEADFAAAVTRSWEGLA